MANQLVRLLQHWRGARVGYARVLDVTIRLCHASRTKRATVCAGGRARDSIRSFPTDQKGRLMATPEPQSIDEELLQEIRMVELARRGDAAGCDWFLRRYLPFVLGKVAQYKHFGLDTEELIRAGLMGLYRAVRDFRLGQSSLRAYAELQITREIIKVNKANLLAVRTINP